MGFLDKKKELSPKAGESSFAVFQPGSILLCIFCLFYGENGRRGVFAL